MSVPALEGYLQRECPHQLTAESLTTVKKRLLVENGRVVCDSYGNTELLTQPLLPVVCHRKDADLFQQQKARCMAEAASGAVLVSARISKGEQEIIDEAIAQGHSVILITDNGFPEIYHPSEARLQLCTANRLLLVTPWAYQYHPANEEITVAQCKAMNCIAQAICHTKDDWWKK